MRDTVLNDLFLQMSRKSAEISRIFAEIGQRLAPEPVPQPKKPIPKPRSARRQPWVKVKEEFTGLFPAIYVLSAMNATNGKTSVLIEEHTVQNQWKIHDVPHEAYDYMKSLLPLAKHLKESGPLDWNDHRVCLMVEAMMAHAKPDGRKPYLQAAVWLTEKTGLLFTPQAIKGRLENVLRPMPRQALRNKRLREDQIDYIKAGGRVSRKVKG